MYYVIIVITPILCLPTVFKQVNYFPYYILYLSIIYYFRFTFVYYLKYFYIYNDQLLNMFLFIIIFFFKKSVKLKF